MASIVLAIVTIYAVNYYKLQAPLNEAIDSDARNHGISASARYSWYVDPSVIVFDLEGVIADKAPADLFRLFLQFAERLKDRSFDQVQLARHGDVRFLLDGASFRQLGQEYGRQNVVYTIRTFPEKLRRPNGSRAFDQWTGGVLGVTARQMDDFKEFVIQWIR